MQQVLDKAECDLKTSRDREDVLDGEFDFASIVLHDGILPKSDVARDAWMKYVHQIDAQLYSHLRVSTYYDYDQLEALNARACRV